MMLTLSSTISEQYTVFFWSWRAVANARGRLDPLNIVLSVATHYGANRVMQFKRCAGRSIIGTSLTNDRPWMTPDQPWIYPE